MCGGVRSLCVRCYHLDRHTTSVVPHTHCAWLINSGGNKRAAAQQRAAGGVVPVPLRRQSMHLHSIRPGCCIRIDALMKHHHLRLNPRPNLQIPWDRPADGCGCCTGLETYVSVHTRANSPSRQLSWPRRRRRCRTGTRCWGCRGMRTWKRSSASTGSSRSPSIQVRGMGGYRLGPGGLEIEWTDSDYPIHANITPSVQTAAGNRRMWSGSNRSRRRIACSPTRPSARPSTTFWSSAPSAGPPCAGRIPSSIVWQVRPCH